MYRRSKELGTVILSVKMTGANICVDFFQRKNGLFGYEEYRRDVETGEGWFPIGFHSHLQFQSLQKAKTSALLNIGWLDTEMADEK